MKKALIFIAVAVILVVAICVGLNSDKKEEIEEFADEFTWHANYIWLNEDGLSNEDKQNTWMAFRKNFIIKDVNTIKHAFAHIAADSKYYLYINNKLVVLDGSLKRYTSEKTFYDTVDISEYLVEGKNNISVLVWHFGKTGFSHMDLGQGMLLFQANIDDIEIVSDDTWKVTKHTGYLNDAYTWVNSIRLSEYNINFNALSDMKDWTTSEYNDETWTNAKIYGSSKEKNIWGELVKRNIPMFKADKSYSKYVNSDKYENQIKADDEVIELILPTNLQFTPYFKIEATEGTLIRIDPDLKFETDGGGHETYYKCIEGVQEFESLPWINGDRIYMYIPKGVKILELGYRKTSYNVKDIETFESSDEFLNTLFTMCKDTVLVNMRDTYMDCPDRERALWIGDAAVDMEEAQYSLGIESKELFKRSAMAFIENIGEKENVFKTVVPSECAEYQLPIQNLIAITAIYDYYEYTNDKELLEYSYDAITKYLSNWTINLTNNKDLLDRNKNYETSLWEWYDAVQNPNQIDSSNDEQIAELFWYYYALDRTSKIAEAINRVEDYENYSRNLSELKESINNKYWNGTYYKSEKFENYDVRINSVAILSGLASDDKKEIIAKDIINHKENSAFMEKFVLEALCESGKINEAKERIKERYKDMVDGKENISATIWEYWNPSESLNHGWSCSPIMTMNKYIAGIYPEKEGFEEVLIKPELCDLKVLKTSVDTVNGKINLDFKIEENEEIMEFSVPVISKIAVKKKENMVIKTGIFSTIYKNGQNKDNRNIKYDSEDEKYIYFKVEPGNYKFKIK